MRKTALIILLLAAVPLAQPGMWAQGGIKSLIVNPITKNENTRQDFTAIVKQSASSGSQSGVAYYRAVVRKNMWYEGLGEPITQAEAYHLPCYFRLAAKNEQGHYQLVQAMCGDTLTANHGRRHYVLGSSDEGTSGWGNRLKTVAQWYITCALDGETVAEERAYDKDGYVIYSFIPTPNAPGLYTGCYNGPWGLPVDMDEKPDEIYGSVVQVRLDRCGRDSIVDFLDGGGYRRLNPNGVDQHRYQYDDKDRVTLSTSHNVVGDMVLDNWGNCGVQYTYNDEEDRYSIVTIDREGAPMQMPTKRANGLRTYTRCDVTLDKHGRIAEKKMLTAEGDNSTTSTGLHQIVYNYNEDSKGHYTSTTVRYFDLDGNEMSEAQATSTNN